MSAGSCGVVLWSFLFGVTKPLPVLHFVSMSLSLTVHHIQANNPKFMKCIDFHRISSLSGFLLIRDKRQLSLLQMTNVPSLHRTMLRATTKMWRRKSMKSRCLLLRRYCWTKHAPSLFFCQEHAWTRKEVMRSCTWSAARRPVCRSGGRECA